MNFRQCVIDCIAEGEVVQSFNRLRDRPITPQLLSLLGSTDKNQMSLAELEETEQELLACFILFVHRHVWRKMKFAEARVTRVHEDRTYIANNSQSTGAVGNELRSYVRCDAQLRPDFGSAVGQEAP